jgi:hypothetical protein
MGHEDVSAKLGNVTKSDLQDVSPLPTERRIGTDRCKLVIRVNRKRQLALGLGLLRVQEEVLSVEAGTGIESERVPFYDVRTHRMMHGEWPVCSDDGSDLAAIARRSSSMNSRSRGCLPSSA